MQKRELARRQSACFIVHCRLPRRRVEMNLTVAQKRRCRAALPSNNRADTRQQFAHIEGLCEVIVRTQVQTIDAFIDAVTRSQYDHCHRVSWFSELTQVRNAVFRRQPEIE